MNNRYTQIKDPINNESMWYDKIKLSELSTMSIKLPKVYQIKSC